MIRVVLALVLGAVATGGAWFALESMEGSVRQELFVEQSTRVSQVATMRIANVQQQVELLGIYAEERLVTGEAFTPYLTAMHSRYPLFRALAWLPVVNDREAFEGQLGALQPGFQITEVDAAGELQRAGDASAWVPFLLVQPKYRNEGLMGMDLGNQPVLAQTMQRSHLLVGVAMAPAQTFPGAPEPAMLLLRYVQRPEGFMGALLEPKSLFDHLAEGRPPGLRLRLENQTTSSVLWEDEGFDATRSRATMLSLGGHTMVWSVSPGADYAPIVLLGRQGILAAGGGFTLLLVAFVLLGASGESR